jgi:KDO2-lipid IV(A) lauroyltransferase
LVTLEDEDALTKATDFGRGTLLLTVHYGSWEIVPQAVSTLLGVSCTVLVRGLANAHVDREIDRLRRTFGAVTVPATVAVRELYRTLQRGGLVIMAADQRAARKSTQVRFFGRLSPTFEGPANLALRMGARMLFTVARRMPNGRDHMRFEPIPTRDLDPGDPTAVPQLMERYLETTERAIRQDPAQWMWMHRRWKHTRSAS